MAELAGRRSVVIVGGSFAGLQAARDLWAPLAAATPPGSAIRTELDANIARIDSLLSGNGPVSP